MKKLSIILIITLFGCSQPLLLPPEYTVIDTINKNTYFFTVDFNVVIKIHEDSSLHYGVITQDGKLIDVNFKKVKNYYK